MDAKFFRKAKKANRAVEYTDSEAIIPAGKSGDAETRVPLPNRRPMTLEERTAAIQVRRDEIATLEEQIESQRKELLELVKQYKLTMSGAHTVIFKNIEIKNLMDRRAALAYPLQWIEAIPGLTLKDIFESKRNTSKIGSDVFQIKRRVEPITSLYVDLGAAAQVATMAKEQKQAGTIAQATAAVTAAAKSAARAIDTTVDAATDAVSTAASAAASAARGAIIGQRRTIKLGKPAPLPPK